MDSTPIVSADQYIQVVSATAVVKCGASWCEPCKKIQPEFDELSREYPDIPFHTIDIGSVKNFEDAPMVTKLPTFLIYREGTPVGLVRGTDLSQVKKIISGW